MLLSANEPSSVIQDVVYVPAGTDSVQEINPDSDTANPSVTGSIEKNTFLFVAFSGNTLAANCLLPAVPATAAEFLGESVTLSTGIITPPHS